jgi:hypothetical protein
MWMREMVSMCDFTDTRYPTAVEGAWVLAQGNTGRYCCVMFAGPEYIKEHNINPMCREDAEAYVESIAGAWVDF